MNYHWTMIVMCETLSIRPTWAPKGKTMTKVTVTQVDRGHVARIFIQGQLIAERVYVGFYSRHLACQFYARWLNEKMEDNRSRNYF